MTNPTLDRKDVLSPDFYATKNSGWPLDPAKPRERYKSSYLDSPDEPLFPFGFGLSCATFA